MASRRFHALLLLLILSALPARVAAAPLKVDSGFLKITGDFSQLVEFSFSGDGFDFSGRGGEFIYLEPLLSCFPCLAGDIISFGTNLFMVAQGTAQLGSVDYGPLNFYLSFRVKGGSAPFVPGGPVTTVTAPFEFQPGGAAISGYPPDVSPLEGGGELFIVPLSGMGTASAQYAVGADGGYYFQTVTYAFEPVPEPATLTLIGTGVGALAIRRRRRGSADA
jgi:hypothetical protein